MSYADYKRALLEDPPDIEGILHRYFHAGQSALFYGSDPNEEPSFKRIISDQIKVNIGIRCHPLQLVICGSAHLGFSPVPHKLGKTFNPDRSDVDIAVVSAELFDRWWTELQDCEKMSQPDRQAIAEDLFWGFINPFKVYELTETGDKWWRLFGGLQTDRACGVRGRVYRTYWNMQNYHKHAILGGHEILKGMRTT